VLPGNRLEPYVTPENPTPIGSTTSALEPNANASEAASPTADGTLVTRFATGVWAIIAAFGTYFCMYGFRKPFTAAAYEGGSWLGWDEKSVLVTSQILGYMVSKFIGIRVISQMPPGRRVISLLGLIGIAELALIGFGSFPSPWQVVPLFVNGLMLGMVFGLVLGFLEGRRATEALTAGLCASFILADGATKSVGLWLLEQGVTERWMPAAAGGLFTLPLLLFAWMLSRIRPPNADDQQHRMPRHPMGPAERHAFVTRFGLPLAMLVLAYLLVTVVRSLRADFAPELWRGLGVDLVPSTFSVSEWWVGLGVFLVSGLGALIRSNRRALLTALVVSAVGGLLMAAAVWLIRQQAISPLSFMIMLGIGLYLPYVAMHTAIFDRMIAVTRQPSNLGFLMYIADAFGYLGYVAVILGRHWLAELNDITSLVLWLGLVVGVVNLLLFGAAGVYFAWLRIPPLPPTQSTAGVLSHVATNEPA